MNPTFRLSRIRAPRGTIGAIVLLIAFFISFGIAVAGAAPAVVATEPAPTELLAALLNDGGH